MIPRPVIALGKLCPNNHRAEDLGQPGAISHPSPDKEKYLCFDTLAVSPLPQSAPRCSAVQSPPAPTACPACAARPYRITVPDIRQAADFSSTCRLQGGDVVRPFADEKGNFMADLLNVDPRVSADHPGALRLRLQHRAVSIQFARPENRYAEEQRRRRLSHRLLCRRHQSGEGLFDGKGVKTFFGPFPVNEGPAAGQSIVYFLAPWGLQMEIISYPKGMAYEKSAPVVLWSPRDPAK
jgi:hypothetical protein